MNRRWDLCGVNIENEFDKGGEVVVTLDLVLILEYFGGVFSSSLVKATFSVPEGLSAKAGIAVVIASVRARIAERSRGLLFILTPVG